MNTKITFADGKINEFGYCGCGNIRRWKRDSSGFTKYFFDEDNRILIEYDETDRVKSRYVLGPNIDEIICKITSTGVTYYHYDGLGSVVNLTDENSNIVGTYEYAPFGKILRTEGSAVADNIFTFTGREFDIDSQLYYYRARYYASDVGRFLTKDPLLATISTSPPSYVTCGGAHTAGCGVGRNSLNIYNPSDLHPYVYVRNNPVNLKDPKGTSTIFICNADLKGRWYQCTCWQTPQTQFVRCDIYPWELPSFPTCSCDCIFEVLVGGEECGEFKAPGKCDAGWII